MTDKERPDGSADDARPKPARGTIYYIGAFRLPSGNAAAQRVRANAKALRDIGFRVILVGVHEDAGRRRVVRRGSYARDGFHSVSINSGKGRLRKAARRLFALTTLRILRMRFARPSVICYNQLSLSQAQIQAYCWWKGIRFSPDATEWYGRHGGNPISDIITWIDTTIRIRLLNPLGDGIVTTSPFLTSFYARMRKPQLQLPTLFDRSETGAGHGDDPPAGQRPLTLVYAGTPFNLKEKRPNPAYMKERLDTVLSILDEVNRDRVRFTLDVFGLKREQYLSAFGLRDEDFNRPWVRFFGQVEHSRVLQAIRAADFTIFLREPIRANRAGFPTKFAESITCGTPVITNPMDNLDAFAREGSNCILIDVGGQPKSIDALRSLADDAERVAAMKEYCRAADTFDYRSWIEPVEAFVRQWLPEPSLAEAGATGDDSGVASHPGARV